MKVVSACILLFVFCCFSFKNTVPVPETEAGFSCEKTGIIADSLYENVKPYNINFTCVDIAVQGYNRLLNGNKLKNKKYLTIIDMSRSSSEERLFIIDAEEYKVVHTSLVAHGKNSGDEYATHFSNVPESKQTSLGLYLTAETYHGQHGLSMRLDGLSPFNNKARERSIVIHSADYVSKQFIEEHNRLGRSWGCPALPLGKYDFVVNTIKEGSCLFIYHPLLSSSPGYVSANT